MKISNTIYGTLLVLLLFSFSTLSYAGNWSYSTTPGNSFHKTVKLACTESPTVLDFSFPFNGVQNPRMCIRNDGSVIIGFKGEFICDPPTVYTCTVPAIFTTRSGKKIRENLDESGPSDNSTGMIFLSPVRPFLDSTYVALDLTFYQEGTHEVDFSLKGLDKKKVF